MKQLKLVAFIAGKDLKLFFRDRLALFFFIIFPFLFVIMFNFMLRDVGGEDERLELHVATQDGPEGIISQQIIEALGTQGEWTIIEMDYDEARRAVEDEEIEGFLVFPANFTEGVLTGSGAQLEVVANAEAINTRAALYGLAQTIASRIGSQYVVISATSELLEGQVIQQPFPGQEGAAPEESFIEFDVEKVGEVEPYNANNYLIPGYLVMFVFFASALSAEAIVRERQNNTLERLLSSSVRREAILGGMFTGTAAKGLIQIVIFWVLGILAFNVDIGRSPAAVILLSILMVIVSAAFAIMLATLVKTQRSAGSIAVLASLIMAPLGGCWWPLFILPRWMQGLAKITPHGWANTGFNKLMLFGADFSSVVPEMLVIVGFTIVFGGIAIWRFRTSAV